MPPIRRKKARIITRNRIEVFTKLRHFWKSAIAAVSGRAVRRRKNDNVNVRFI